MRCSPNCDVDWVDSLQISSGRRRGPKRRRVVVARFPYSIVYREDPDASVIVAVAHQRRRPGYWQRRNQQSVNEWLDETFSGYISGGSLRALYPAK